jgi:hypothetical protein
MNFQGFAVKAMARGGLRRRAKNRGNVDEAGHRRTKRI